MSERIVLDPVGHLIETIASHLEKRGKDFSASAIVFPGKRPAHFLRKELALRAGGSIIPPKIFSVDEFVLSLYQHLHPEPIFDLDPIDAVALLHLVHSELKERLGGDYFASLDTFIPIGLKLSPRMRQTLDRLGSRSRGSDIHQRLVAHDKEGRFVGVDGLGLAPLP